MVVREEKTLLDIFYKNNNVKCKYCGFKQKKRKSGFYLTMCESCAIERQLFSMFI